MTPNHLTGLVPLIPAHATGAIFDLAPVAAPDLGHAAISIGRYQQAQGPVPRRFRDGRVMIDAGGIALTGRPVRDSAPKGWWARITGRPS